MASSKACWSIRAVGSANAAVSISTALVEEALNLAYHGARAQDQSFNITLERDFAKGIAPIDLVPQDMTRVLLNLFGNGFYAATKRAEGRSRADVQADAEGLDTRYRRCGRNPRPGQRHRHSGRHQGQTVSAVLHHQADRRGDRARTVDQLRHRHPTARRDRSRSTASPASSPNSRSACRGRSRGRQRRRQRERKHLDCR